MANGNGHGNKRQEAYQKWLTGMTFSQIAEELNISRNTICTWASRHNWSEDKINLSEQFRNSLYEKASSKAEEIAEYFWDSVLLGSRMGVEVFREGYEKKIHILDFRNGKTNLHQWAKTLQIMGQTYDKTLPEANHELMQQMLKELEGINEKLSALGTNGNGNGNGKKKNGNGKAKDETDSQESNGT